MSLCCQLEVALDVLVDGEADAETTSWALTVFETLVQVRPLKVRSWRHAGSISDTGRFPLRWSRAHSKGLTHSFSRSYSKVMAG